MRVETAPTVTPTAAQGKEIASARHWVQIWQLVAPTLRRRAISVRFQTADHHDVGDADGADEEREAPRGRGC